MLFRREVAKKQLDVNINPPEDWKKGALLSRLLDMKVQQAGRPAVRLLATDWVQEEEQMEIFSAVAGSTYGVGIIFITKTSIYSCYTAINFPWGVRDSFFQMPCFSNTIYPINALMEQLLKTGIFN